MPRNTIIIYSKLISFFKFFCIFIALIIISLFFIIPIFAKKTKYLDLSSKEMINSAITNLNDSFIFSSTLNKAKFYGLTDKKEKYVIEANKAIRLSDKNTILLITINANMIDSKNKHVILESKKGNYNQARKLLDLTDDVKITYDKNNHLFTERLVLDLNSSNVYTDQKVRIKTEESILDANSMETDYSKNISYFKGPIHLVITPKKNK